MKLDRKVTSLLRNANANDQDDGFVEGTPSERLGMMWKLACDEWAFEGKGHAEQRLQRDVTKLIKLTDKTKRED